MRKKYNDITKGLQAKKKGEAGTFKERFSIFNENSANYGSCGQTTDNDSKENPTVLNPESSAKAGY